MSGLLDDVRFALRLLGKSPGFAGVAILTLALGIGANTAIFSVLRGVLLKPLGYPQPERLVFISSQFSTLKFDQFWISAAEYFELRERSRSFEAIGAFRTGSVNLGTATDPERVRSAVVTADLFRALGRSALLGRTFTAEETLPNAAPTVVLSHDIWQRAFAGDPAIVGRVVDVDGRKPTVIGVMPAGFDVNDSSLDVYLPAGLDPAFRGRRGNHYLYLIGRLAPGVSMDQARAELESLLASWKQVVPDTHTPTTDTHRLRYDGLLDQIVGDARRALWVLQVAVLAVLLIACANLANLLLARSETRQREFAVRAALGAGRPRLLRQFVVEGVLLSLFGAVAGVALAVAALRVLMASGLEGLPRASDVSVDLPVLWFSLGLAFVTGVVFGLAPMLHLADKSLGSTLKEGGQRSGTARGRLRRGLVVAEMGIAAILVVAASLLLRTFWNLMQVDAGFPREQLVTFGLVLPNATYPDPTQRTAFYARLLDHFRQTPGVQHAAIMNGLPPVRELDANDTEFEGITPQPDRPPQNVDYYQMVSTGYLDTMKIVVLDGRGFEPADASSASPVALVNQTLARRFYEEQSPVGRRIRPAGLAGTPWFTIVGVVEDVKQAGLSEPVGTELYFCFEQLPLVAKFAPGDMHVVLRTALPVTTLATDVRRIVGQLDPGLPIVDMRTMDTVFEETLSRPRLLAWLLGLFALLALVLAAIGTYGVLAYSVTERSREIGLRMALGADRSQVLSMVLRDGLLLAGIGLTLGLVGAAAANRVLSALLYGISPTDPVTLGAVLGVMLMAALAASYLPARRAAAVNPMHVLRNE